MERYPSCDKHLNHVSNLAGRCEEPQCYQSMTTNSSTEHPLLRCAREKIEARIGELEKDWPHLQPTTAGQGFADGLRFALRAFAESEEGE